MSINKFLILFLVVIVLLSDLLVFACLITNCPRGGKRNGKFGLIQSNIKPCIPCGPGRTGQCFGPNICCGPFGCLMGSTETAICEREGFFHDPEPCIAGNASCRKQSGRCAADGICCSQDSCFNDRSCSNIEKSGSSSSDNLVPSALDFYNLMSYQAELSADK